MKDSSAVVTFMANFARLLNLDLSPEDLKSIAREDEVIKKLCNDLLLSEWSLTSNERKRRQLFAQPVDPAFIDQWRLYEERYKEAVADVWLSGIDLSGLIGDSQSNATVGAPKSRLDREWENADDDAGEQSTAIDTAIEFALEQATQDWRDFPDDFADNIKDGAAAWKRLKADAGFDLRGVFRRRELIPFTLVPRHVASKYGSAEKLSLLTHLQQAHEAFIFGAPFAAIALMRSVLETVLRDHYGAQGRDLEEQISSCESLLPLAASMASLNRLRQMSNDVLHMNKSSSRLPDTANDVIEKEIVSLLLVLRALIEEAPRAAAKIPVPSRHFARR